MSQPLFKEAISICKSIMRNGFDAHVVNAALQQSIIAATGVREVDLATDAAPEDLVKLFPLLERPGDHLGVMGLLRENDTVYRFYRMNISEAPLPEMGFTRLTHTMLRGMKTLGPLPRSLVNGMATLAPAPVEEGYQGFLDFAGGSVGLEGLPDETLCTDYVLGIRALRYAANHGLPVEPGTWLAIVRASQRILDYVPARTILDEWRKVEARHMWKFVTMLLESQILHGLIPELAALGQVRQTKNATGVEESILEHTLAALKVYPEGDWADDWFGTFALLFHDVGKLYTAEFFEGRWTFYQHHRVGATVTRKILRRLHMLPEEIELICQLVSNHMRFQFMMTDRGIRKFMALEQHPRLIAMARANVKARDDTFTAFNHNTKYLARAETPVEMLEPLLNGNEIMDHTGLKPGPHVGDIRAALLNAQISGEVTNMQEAAAFVRRYVKKTW